MIHGARMIPFDGRPHLPESVRQLDGDSRGRWEGDTLVVDTINFTDKTPFRGPPARTRQDIFSSKEMHVVERFTRVDAETIVYRFTVEDPGTWTRPWSGEILLREIRGPDLRVRMSRRKLWPGPYPRGGTRQRESLRSTIVKAGALM